MKTYKIIFFVGILLVINQFWGIPSGLKVFINIILAVLLIAIGLHEKFRILKEKRLSDKPDVDQNIFVEHQPEKITPDASVSVDFLAEEPAPDVEEISPEIPAEEDNTMKEVKESEEEVAESAELSEQSAESANSTDESANEPKEVQ
ncbi:MAG TPA: hypothetical protein P5328_01400 [Candidatus Paceibacterota bacterium]|nr:hypothetical protein [Candidatus Paceibacterota bacterium]HRZ34708.1 hypothetical protein [Candidatus Paceibacterota bacterium]